MVRNRATNEDDLPEHFSCPVCFYIPEGEVYQCVDGHVLCKKCHTRLTSCPQCRRVFDKAQPIRCRHLEQLILEKVKVECFFKANGCLRNLPKGKISTHEKGCPFDIQKFGNFICLCKAIGYPNCDFKLNNGNTKEGVEHFVSKHGCALVEKTEGFQMELQSFQSGKRSQFWTPVVLNLKDKQCYLLTLTILNSKDNSVVWLSLYLPYSNSDNLTKCHLQLEYKISGEFSSFGFIQVPMTLERALPLLPFNLPCRFPMKTQKDLLVTCHLKGKTQEKKKLESIACSKRSFGEIIKPIKAGKKTKKDYSSTKRILGWSLGPVFIAWLAYALVSIFTSPKFTRSSKLIWQRDMELWEGNKNLTAFLEHEETQFRQFDEEILNYFQQIFIKEDKETIVVMPYMNKSEFTEVKKQFLFLTAKYGYWEPLKYLLDVGAVEDINWVNPEGKTAMFLTLEDPFMYRGYDKLQVLHEIGNASFDHTIDGGQTLLQIASYVGHLQAMDYLLRKGFKVNSVDNKGNTALHAAVLHEDEDTALKMSQLLMDHGVDCNMTSADGDTALDSARLYRKIGGDKVISYLIIEKCKAQDYIWQ